VEVSGRQVAGGRFGPQFADHCRGKSRMSNRPPGKGPRPQLTGPKRIEAGRAWPTSRPLSTPAALGTVGESARPFCSSSSRDRFRNFWRCHSDRALAHLAISQIHRSRGQSKLDDGQIVQVGQVATSPGPKRKFTGRATARRSVEAAMNRGPTPPPGLRLHPTTFPSDRERYDQSRVILPAGRLAAAELAIGREGPRRAEGTIPGTDALAAALKGVSSCRLQDRIARRRSKAAQIN